MVKSCENLNEFEIISSKKSIRSIRGRRLTDKESKYMQELEIAKEEMRIDEIIRGEKNYESMDTCKCNLPIE